MLAIDVLMTSSLNRVSQNIPEGVQLNYEQNFMDAMQILPKLPKGLDVNVRFTG